MVGIDLIRRQILDYNKVSRGPLDIPDPLEFTDPMGYEKCVTMCKKSIENLVQLLEQEEEAEAKKRPKIVKLPDPTIFTITSPSQWTRNNLRSPDISSPCAWPAVAPPPTPHPSQPPPSLQPPQELPECADLVNLPARTPEKIFSSLEVSSLALTEIIIPTKVQPHIEVVRFQDSPPQPPECEIEDNIWKPSCRLKHFEEKTPSEPPVHAPVAGLPQPPCLALSPPQPPECEVEDNIWRPSFRLKHLEDKILAEEPRPRVPAPGAGRPEGCIVLSPPQAPPVDVEDSANILNNIKKHLDLLPEPGPQLSVFFPTFLPENTETGQRLNLTLAPDLQRPEVDIVDTVNNQTVGPHSTDLRENEINTIVPFFPPTTGPQVGKITIVGLSTDLTSPNVDVDDIMNYPPKTKYKIFQEKFGTIEIIHQVPVDPHEIPHFDIFKMSSTDLQCPDVFINDTTNLAEERCKELSEGVGFPVNLAIRIPTSGGRLSPGETLHQCHRGSEEVAAAQPQTYSSLANILIRMVAHTLSHSQIRTM